MGASMELRSVNGHGNPVVNDSKTPSNNGSNRDVNDKSLETTQVNEVPATGDQRDAQALARLGKKPVLKVRAMLVFGEVMSGGEMLNDGGQRRFSFMAMLGFTCTVLVTWEVIPM